VAKRIGVFVDVSNLYYCLGKRYNGKKLDYSKYLAYVKDLGEVQQAIAYGSQANGEASNFIHALKAIGFTTKYKETRQDKRRSSQDVDIAIDAVRMLGKLDMVLLGSANGDLAPLVTWCKEQGCDVVVLACGINRLLKESATKCIEIPESLLESKSEATQAAE
jgi:uncharacterized LabA/DUF88 family protein